jgi:hypothetical protein
VSNFAYDTSTGYCRTARVPPPSRGIDSTFPPCFTAIELKLSIGHVGALEVRTHPSHEFVCSKGLHEVVIHAGLEPSQPRFLAGRGEQWNP